MMTHNTVKRRYYNILLLLIFGALFSTANATGDGGIVERIAAIPFTGIHTFTTGVPPIVTSYPLETGKSSSVSYWSITEPSTQQSKKIKNMITFKINEESNLAISDNFTAWVTVKIEYGHSPSSLEEVTKTFTVDYNLEDAAKYNVRQYFHFEGAEYVKLTIMDVNAPSLHFIDTHNMLVLENEMYITRYVELPATVPAPTLFNHTTPAPSTSTPDHLTVNWQWAPNTGNNATQLEWVWVENDVLNNYPVSTGGNDIVFLFLLFLNNGTRIDLPYNATSYDIPLLYPNAGRLYYRIRAVNIKENGGRTDGPWQMNATTHRFDFAGHNNYMNWRSTTSFAEEGKRKSVVEYYDGSLRSRQTVTKDNTTNTTVTAETLYDGQGRPAIQILPSPGISDIIQYQAGLNRFNGQGTDQDPAELFDLEPIATPGSSTPQLVNTSGTAKYYSPNNDAIATGADQTIPDAEGYPYTVTRYTPDATGRVLAQSGVGPAHNMGSTHETKYYYGTPGQEELDGLFGTEVGNFTHYSKNMVKDANGQMSVSYVDMHGRTVATALAGDAPACLDGLDKNDPTHYPGQAGTSMTRSFLDNGSNVLKGNTIESINSILVPAPTDYAFRYRLDPRILSTAACEGTTPATLCYDCLYNLEIAIVDESGELDHPVTLRKYTNVSLNADPDDDCNTGIQPMAIVSGNDATPQDIAGNTISFNTLLPVGSYSVRKTLSISESSFQYYKDLYINKALCKTEQEMIDSVYSVLVNTSGCTTPVPVTCQDCSNSLGTYEAYRDRYLLSIGVSLADASTTLLNEIRAAYNSENDKCKMICGGTGAGSVSQSLPTIRQMMLADMMPYGGQYAKENAPVGVQTMYQKYDIFSTTFPATNQPYYKNPRTDNISFVKDYYYDDLDARDITVHPDPAPNAYAFLNAASTTREVFTQLFKNSWARSLLPYHPEYQRLLFAEQTLAASYNWINQFSQANTWAAGSAYSNPLAIDPFFSVAGTADAKTKVQNDIANYQAMGVGMWQLAYGDVRCKSISDEAQRKACYLNGNPNNLPPPYAGFTTTENDQAWKVFKNLYMEARNRQLAMFIATQKPLPAGEQEEKDLVAQGYHLWFPRNYQQTAGQYNWDWWVTTYPSTTVPPVPAGGNTSPGQVYQSRCSSYIAQWKNKLLQCGTLADMSNIALRDQILNEITTAMAIVCEKGSDAANSMGSSTVKPSTPVDGSPRSFEEVIDQVYANHNINPPKDYYCNPYVIEFPKPYGKNPTLTQEYTTVVDSCACSHFGSLKVKVLAANYDPMVLSSINAYLTANNMEILTPVMHQALLNCSQYNQLVCDSTFHQVTASCYDPDPCAYRCYAKQTIKSSNDRATVPTCEEWTDIISCFFDVYWAVWPDSVEFFTNCKSSFTNWFNGGQGSNYTWEQISSLYEATCGGPLNICIPCLKTVNCAEPTTNCHYVFAPHVLPTPQPLPDYLKCGGWPPQNKCLTCDGLVKFVNEFKTIFGPPYNSGPIFTDIPLTPEQIEQNMLFARFLNFRTGFQFTWLQYSQAVAAANCDIGSGTGGAGVVDLVLNSRSGNTPAQYIASNSITFDPGFGSGIDDRFEAFIQLGGSGGGGGGPQTVICRDTHPLNDTTGYTHTDPPCHDVRIMSTVIGQQLYQIRKEYLLKAFDQAYRDKCLSSASIEEFTATYLTSEYHYTLYYYDMGGNLVKTVPPKGVNARYADVGFLNSVKTARSNCQLSTANCQPVTPNHTFATQYRYNSLNQVTAQNTPDAGTSRFWYDRLGRLVVSQNAQQAIENNYSYTLYDPLGRIKEVGQKPQAANSMTQTISQDIAALDKWINTDGGTKQQITRTSYDIAAANTNGLVITQQNLRNRVSYVQVFDTDPGAAESYAHQTATYYTYDIHGNVDKLLQDLKGITTAIYIPGARFKLMAYEYDLISGKVNKVSYQPGYTDAFYHKYSYDAENRITEAYTSRDDIYWERDAAYRYFKHGPLARTVLGQLSVQGLDYAYTLQGWLKGVNSTALQNAPSDLFNDGSRSSVVARDVLGFALHYYDQLGTGSNFVDYTPINGKSLFARPGAGTGFETRSLYNGNIAAMTVNNAGLSLKLDETSNNTFPVFNQYRYDQLNRIVGMQVHKGLDEANNTWAPVAIDDYKETVSYDPNGNIERYQRRGDAARGLMDDLQYVYKPASNKLDKAVDNAADDLANYIKYKDIKQGQQSGNYRYDAIGNLIGDASEGINTIRWTVYGKIQNISKNGGNIQYTYDAAGNRISKTYQGKTTIYVRDASGNVMSVYEFDPQSDAIVQKELDLYGSSRLGITTQRTVTPQTVGLAAGFGNAIFSTFTRGEKIFELSNHLGNVLAAVSDKKFGVDGVGQSRPNGIVDYYMADVVSVNDYYPGGMLMPGRRYEQPTDRKYRYGFNGKEKDTEVKGEGNSYDYGARIYDPRIGRFLSTDPEEEKFPHMTPYQISSNSPIWRIDPDGEWDIEVHAHKTRGKYGYATMIVKNRSGDIIFQTVVKVVGSHRLRNGTNGDTPEGTYKILGWRKTGSRYNTTSFGPNDLLALDYDNNGQGGSRDGMHVHGGRGYYRKGKALMSTHGCMRINDDDIKELKRITTQLEASDKLEKKGSLTVKDDLVNPVEYSSDPSVRRAIDGGGDFIQLLKDGFNSIKKTFNQIVDALMPQQPVVGIIQDAGGDGYTNMRSSPGSGDPFRVDAGTAVEILQTGDKFTKIKYNNKEGYIHNNYVKKKE